MPDIILASASPRRKQLLEWADIPFTVEVAGTAEDFPDGLSFEEIALYIAAGKARAVQQKSGRVSGVIILAADTIVVLDSRMIGKPASREEAISTLVALSGRTHQVVTGVCILLDEKRVQFSETTEVTFHPLSLAQIEYYVDRYKPYDKAGAYAIQEWIGVTAVKSIKGDFYNVMGLPVSRVVKELAALGTLPA